jgi:tetratricopeptide (TPR) repeat protein
MARLVIQFPEVRGVLIDGDRRGETNQVIAVDAGTHVVRLEGETDPPSQDLIIADDTPADAIYFLEFRPAAVAIQRFSPLYCRYNGFLLGQFVTLAFARYGRAQYAERRMRMLEFLREIELNVEIPEEPFEIGSEGHSALILGIVGSLAERSRELTEFMLIGSTLAQYGGMVLADPESAQFILEQARSLCAKYALPEIDVAQFLIDPDTGNVDGVLSAALAWLTKVIAALDVEHDRAFVIMPFRPPFASYFSMFYRPAIERAGYRAFRAWGGLADEDYCDLLLALISRCGMVWADVSDLNVNVLYEIGASHALRKLSMLVTSEDDAHAIPSNIGHDAVVSYSPSAPDWPESAIALQAMMLHAMRVAAGRGQRLRITRSNLAEVIESVTHGLKAFLIPPEAHEAARSGQHLLHAGEFASAVRAFDDAIELGLEEPANFLGRGCSRIGAEKLAEAVGDLTCVLDSDAGQPLRAAAAYFRGVAYERQLRTADAFDDYSAAIELGYPDATAVDARERCRRSAD